MILTENGVLKLMQRIKSFITAQLNTKANSVHTHAISEIENLESQLGGGIPLSGSNQISGSLIPSTDNSIDIGSSTKNIKMLYTKGIIIDGKTIDTDANDNMTFDSHIVDTIEEQGNGYIRYSNGIQICWGSVVNSNNVDTGKSRFSFPKAFTDEHINVVATPNISALYAVTAQVESMSTWILNTIGLWTSPASYTGSPMPASYIAIGTWK